MSPITYPARPRNGGPLDIAMQAGLYPDAVRSGVPPVYFQPKYNGWRLMLHLPTGTAYYRHGEPVTGDVRRALQPAIEKAQLLLPHFVWLDCEALERRHGIAQGTLVVLDWMEPGLCYLTRRSFLEAMCDLRHFAFVNAERCIHENSIMLVPHYGPAEALALWEKMQAINVRLGCTFYEGAVTKLATSEYPIQLRSDSEEFTGWVKHRFTTR